MEQFKQQKGSITLFVLLSMLFFMLFIAGMYMLSANKETIGIAQTSRIKEIYEKDINRIDDVYETIQKNSKHSLKEIAKPGDYIQYNVEDKTFTISEEQTGQPYGQTFNTKEYDGLWQVLYNDDVHGLQIISEKIVAKITLGNSEDVLITKQVYNSCIDTLNSFCANYINSKYAIKARLVGSNPLNTKDIDDIYTNNEYIYISQYANDFKNAHDNTGYDIKAMNNARNQSADGIYNIDTNYCMASRYINSNSENTSFGIKQKDTTVEGDNLKMIIVYSNGTSKSNEIVFGIRPVITLKDGIKTNKGDGSKTNYFQILEQ